MVLEPVDYRDWAMPQWANNVRRRLQAVPSSYFVNYEDGMYYAIPRDPSLDVLENANARALIQSAISLSTNKKLELAAHVYELDDYLTTIEGLYLKGEPGASLKLADGANCNMFKDFDVESNVILDGLTLDGNKENQSDGAARNERVLVLFKNKSYPAIINCTFKNCRHGASLIIQDSNHILIDRFRGLNQGDLTPPAAWDCDHIWIGFSQQVLLQNMFLDGCDDTGIAQDNVQVSHLNHIIFKNCRNSFSWWNGNDSSPVPAGLYVSDVTVYVDNYGFFSGYAAGLSNWAEKVSLNHVRFIGGFNPVRLIGVKKVRLIDVTVEGATYAVILADCENVKAHLSTFDTCTDAFRFEDTSDKIRITENEFIAITNVLNKVVSPTNLVCKRNRGYVTENMGTAAIASGTSSKVVDHGLDETPTNIRLTGQHSEVANLYADNIGASQFTVHAKDGNVSADRTIMWIAEA